MLEKHSLVLVAGGISTFCQQVLAFFVSFFLRFSFFILEKNPLRLGYCVSECIIQPSGSNGLSVKVVAWSFYTLDLLICLFHGKEGFRM